MKNAIKLFDFEGTPVYLKYWFFILLLLGIDKFISIFIAVLVHELAHTYVAKKLNHYVDHVYLDLLNGAAAIDTSYSSYKDTIKIVAAGPISNLLLFGIGSLLMSVIPSSFLETFCFINILLFIFNILPIYPLDGGRISKACMQWLTTPSTGRKYNGYLSMVTSILLMIFGIYSQDIILSLFCIFFIYIAYKEITQLY